MTDTASEVRKIYAQYYEKKGVDRNDLLRDSSVLMQSLAADMALLRALRRIAFERKSAAVLDVGGGSGGSLLSFLQIGMASAQLSAIDILPERIEEGRHRLPGVRFELMDATSMSFADSSFSLVCSSTMFLQLVDDDLAARIAAEMVRVTRPGGYVLVRDWTWSKPGETSYRGVDRRRLRRLFPQANLKLVGIERGSLLPPIGRFLSRWSPGLYFAVHGLLPFLVALKVYILRKTDLTAP